MVPFIKLAMAKTQYIPLGISQNDKNSASKSFTDLSKDDSVYTHVRSWCTPMIRRKLIPMDGVQVTHTARVQVDPASTVKTDGNQRTFVSKVKIVEFKPDIDVVDKDVVCIHYMNVLRDGKINNVDVATLVSRFPTYDEGYVVKKDDVVFSPIGEREPTSSLSLWQRFLKYEPFKPKGFDDTMEGIHVYRSHD